MANTLYEKVFDRHVVRRLGDDQYQLFIGLHMIHEVTSAQGFASLRERGAEPLFPERNIATIDHIIPTDTRARPFRDLLGETMVTELEKNVRLFGLTYLSAENGENGIVHVIGPENGLSQPGLTIACGDSHTSTHGAFGAVAMGIGTSQVRDVLATQTIIVNRLKVRRVEINGVLDEGVTAKDVILHVINMLGPQGGVGYAYEFGGDVVDAMTMDERMTMCNMSVEAGARCGYVNPDQTTFEYLRGRRHAPDGDDWDTAVRWWSSLASGDDATYDDIVQLDGTGIEPMVTWGVNLGQSIAVTGRVPADDEVDPNDLASITEAREFMGLEAGQRIEGVAIDVAFIGSCTNGRVSDFVEVADALRDSGMRVAPGVQAIAVPGSTAVRNQLISLGIDELLIRAGFEFRHAGCSMCLAMNPDKLSGRQLCASSSNRNFKGRQGSPTGRTMVMSPISVLAAAVTGRVSDPRQVFPAFVEGRQTGRRPVDRRLAG